MFDWRTFGELSAALIRRNVSGQDAEAMMRTAVSRAYYSAFNIARRLAESDTHIEFGGVSVHKAVIGHYAAARVERLTELHEIVHRFCEDRAA